MAYSPQHDEPIQGLSPFRKGVRFNFQENIHVIEVDWFSYLVHLKQVVLSTVEGTKCSS